MMTGNENRRREDRLGEDGHVEDRLGENGHGEDRLGEDIIGEDILGENGLKASVPYIFKNNDFLKFHARPTFLKQDLIAKTFLMSVLMKNTTISSSVLFMAEGLIATFQYSNYHFCH